MARQFQSGFNSQWLGGALQLMPPDHLGNVYFVDATNGSDTANSGTTWSNALATVDGARAKCTANQGDKIYMAPWHAESETTAATAIATMSLAGVDLIGICQGNQRPTFTLGAADSTFSVTAGNCRVSGIKIISDIADCAAGLTLGASADGAMIDNCIFTDGATAKELVIGISLAAACDGCKILNNEFYTVDGGDCASAIKMVGDSARTLIAHNIVFGDYSVSCIDGTTAAQVIVNIMYNDLRNADTTSGGVINLNASSTGQVNHNSLMGGHSIANSYVGAAVVCNHNYTSGAAGASGILAEPSADAD
jgi:hypothetical protein